MTHLLTKAIRHIKNATESVWYGDVFSCCCTLCIC